MFKTGDKVVCIDASDVDGLIEEGKEYFVQQVTGKASPLIAVEDVWWSRSRFKLVDGAAPVSKPPTIPPRHKYMREIKPDVWVDVYDVIRAFKVTDGALQHLLKKALAVGQRGHKDATEDYADILSAANRANQIHLEWNPPTA